MDEKTKEKMIDHYAKQIVDLYRNKVDVDRVRLMLTDFIDQLNHIFQSEKNKFVSTVNRIADEILKSNSNDKAYKEITCAKGCSFCCNIAVGVRSSEADFLVDLIKKNKIDAKIKRLKKQSQKNNKNYHELSKKDKRCIFLKNNECSIYEHRPLTCRIHNSIDNPEFCNTEKHFKKEIRFFKPITLLCFEYATYITEIDLNNQKKVDYMAKLLLERL